MSQPTDLLIATRQENDMNQLDSGKPRGNTWTEDIDREGAFIREPTEFRDWIRRDGSTRFLAEPGRYQLYVSYACPWAHRTLIVRALKGLEDVIGVSVVHPLLDERGWHFEQDAAFPNSVDQLQGATLLRELYDRSVASGQYAGRITVPVLWDTKLGTIVNNESAEIIRMLNSELNAFARQPERDLYPAEHATEIDALNAWIYPSVNNGVYRCGFATRQRAYDVAYDELFAALDRLETILATRRYLVGDQLSEADIRLFTTLVRFDAVYHNHFRCNRNTLREMPNLSGYLRDIAQLPGVMDTVHMDHIKSHYYRSHTTLNPLGIVPRGPKLDLSAPHDRQRLST
jgi:putative glutathione S-transferase